MKSLVKYFIITILLFMVFSTSCCSVYSSSSFSTDSANVHNLKIQKTDSIYFSPIKK